MRIFTYSTRIVTVRLFSSRYGRPPTKETMKSQCNEEIILESTIKPNAIELSIQKLTRKIIEIELHQKIADITKEKLKQKEKEEIDEMRKLEEMQYKKLEKMESFCDEIWKFSTSNDLLTLFNKYLDMPKYAHGKLVAFDIDLDPNIMKLKNEREALKMELAEKNSRAHDLEEKLSDLKVQLQISELHRYNNPEIIRLEKNIEEYQNKIESLNLKISKIEMGVLVKEENYCQLVADGEKNEKFEFVRASELIEKSETIGIRKKSNFSVKKESVVSRKLSNLRRTYRGQS